MALAVLDAGNRQSGCGAVSVAREGDGHRGERATTTRGLLKDVPEIEVRNRNMK